MNFFRTLLTSLFAGALGGATVGGLIANRYVPWENTPKYGTGQCQCQTLAEGVAADIFHYQLIGLIVGVVLALIAVLLAQVWLRRRRAAKGTPVVPSSPV